MSRPDARTLALLAVCLVAALVKFGYAARYEAVEPLAQTPYGDSLVYLDEAARLARSEALLGDEAYYKPPLYTWVLTALEAWDPTTWSLLRRLQAALGVASVALVFVLARRLHGVGAATVAGLLLALYGPMTFAESKVLDTSLALFLQLAALALLPLPDLHELRTRRGFVVGLGLGLAALARPVNLVLVAGLAALLVFRDRAQPAGALALGAALVVLPITAHNKHVSGDLVLVNYSEGHTFWVGHSENANGMYAPPPGFADGVLNERAQEFELASRALGRAASPAEQRDYSYDQGLVFIREHPGRLPTLLLAKLRFALSNYEVSDNYLLSREARKGLLAWSVVPFALLFGLAVAAHLAGGARSGRWLPGLGAGLTLVVLLVFYTTSRYRLPAVPFLAISAGAAFNVLRDGGAMRRAGLVLVAATCCAASIFMPLPESREDIRRSERDFDTVLDLHATELLLVQERTEDAARTFADAIQRTPDEAGMQRLQAALLAALPARQRADFEAALARALGEAEGG